MTTKRHFSRLRGTTTLALVIIGALISTACDTAPLPPPRLRVETRRSPVPPSPTKAGATAANTPQASKPEGNLNCQALVNAGL